MCGLSPVICPKGDFSLKRTAKKVLPVLILVLAAAVAAGFFWFRSNYILVDGTVYSRELQVLDLRQEEVSVSRYETLREALPQCRILWNIPFQEGTQPHDATELQVSTLTDEDVAQLQHFAQLKALNAEGCRDYDVLLTAQKTYPQLQVRYLVPIGGTEYPQDTNVLQLTGITLEEISLLNALPQLETVSLEQAEDMEAAKALQAHCREAGIRFCILLGEETYDENVEQITVTGITDSQLMLLELLPGLKELCLHDPAASAQSILTLAQGPLEVTWDKSICGKVYDHTATEVDLSDTQITSLEEVEQAMEYLPDADHLFLGFCGLDNEEIAAYRERSREKYKVVWVVDLSGKMRVRTDIDNFMPSRDGWGYVRDGEIDNIRYCEDLICIDIGHMGVKDVSFLEPLVNLEYLILAHTEVQYVDAIVNCKKLKFLELDWSCIRDVSPLVELTALEDLNLGMTWPDIKPILKMTWLKNLYLIKGNCKANFYEAMPNTRVVTSGDYTVSSGWRNLPNYYAMRDILGMYYM